MRSPVIAARLVLRRLSALALGALLVAPTGASAGSGLPTRTGLEGRVRAYIVDYAEGDSRTGYAIERAPGDYVELEPTAELAAHVDDLVTIEGNDLPAAPTKGARDRVHVGNRRLRVTSLVTIERAGEGGSPTTVLSGGPQVHARVAVVLLNFGGVTPQSFSVSDAKTTMTTVREYYQELSYGTWNIDSDVFGPFTVPKPADCSLDTIDALARQAAKAGGVAIDTYDHVGVTLPSNAASGLDCACGLAWVGRAPAQPSPGIQHTSLYTCTDTNAFAHEMGHGFGLNHASKAHCKGQVMRRDVYSACDIEEYGNQFNVMGNGLGHMNAFQKTTMGWLTGCNDVRVTRDGVFDLFPIQTASDGVQSLQIATGDSKDGTPLYYYIEYRNPALATFNASDSANGPPREEGAGLHLDVAHDFRVDNGDTRPLLLDVSESGTPGDYADPRLTPGRSFTDPDGRVTVTLVEATGNKASVKVTFPGGGAGVNLCADGSILPSSDDGKSGITLFQDCSYGGWAVTLPPGDYTADQLIAAGALDNDASSLQVRPGYEATVFDGPDFTGESRTLSGKISCLVEQSFNDRMSSLQIRKIAGPDGGAGGAGGAGGGGTEAGVGGSVGGGDTGGDGVDDAGRSCSCRLGGSESGPVSAWMGIAVAGLLASRRRFHRGRR